MSYPKNTIRFPKKNLPSYKFSKEDFGFRFVGTNLHKQIINIIKKEYLFNKQKLKVSQEKIKITEEEIKEFGEEYRNFYKDSDTFLNITIEGFGAKETKKEIERDEEEIIEKAQNKELSPYHNDVVYLDDGFKNSYKKYLNNNNNWEKRQLLLNIKKRDKKINKAVHDLKNEEIEEIFNQKKYY